MTHITLQKDTAGKGPGKTGRMRAGILARLEMGIVAVRACGAVDLGGELLWQHFLCLFDREASPLPFAVRPSAPHRQRRPVRCLSKQRKGKWTRLRPRPLLTLPAFDQGVKL